MKKWWILFEILCSSFIIIETKGIIKTKYDYGDYFSMYLNIDGVNQGYNKITQQLSGSYFNYELNKLYIVANEVFKANNNSYFMQYRNIINRDISFQQYNEDKTNIVVNMYYYDYQKSNSSIGTLSGLSLAFKFRNESFSFVHQLYNNSLIEKMMYIFESVDINSGNIYFGGIPQNSLLQYSGKCKINSEKWGCYLDNIYFTNDDNNKYLYLYKTNITNNYAEFDVGRQCIFVPKDFFYFIKNTFFDKYFQIRKCGFYYNFDAMYIYCNNKDEIKEAIPEYISFVFENQSFRIHRDKLFKIKIDNSIIFLICNALFVEDLDKWIFGSPFLHNFISIFDYSDKSVTLYSNIEINYFYPYNNTQIKMLFIISIIFTFIGSLINLLYKNLI